jgi:hypothetical protein
MAEKSMIQQLREAGEERTRLQAMAAIVKNRHPETFRADPLWLGVVENIRKLEWRMMEMVAEIKREMKGGKG